MNKYKHSRLSSVSDVSSIVPLSTHGAPSAEAEFDRPGYGQPEKKALFDRKHLLVTLASLISLVGAVIVVSPTLSFAWKLGYNRQIQIIGFLLGVMNLCSMSILPPALLALEARLGPSRLQNYDAIIRKDIWSSHTSWTWKVVLVLLNALPLGLGVAYKQFAGGQSSGTIFTSSLTNRMYGLSYPPLGSYASMNNSIFEMLDCNAGFFQASYNDSSFPPNKDFPIAMGFNMILLHNDSAALLDIPTPTYLQEMQSKLRPNETWTVSAQVTGTVARQNTTVASKLAKNDTFFNQTCSSYDVFYLYEYALALASSVLRIPNIYMLSIYPSQVGVSDGGVALYYPISGSDTPSFRAQALVFVLTREICKGTWHITQDNLTLTSGSCNASSSLHIDQSIVENETPFNLDTMPILVHSLGPFGVARKTSPWRLPAYATSAVSAYWARASFMLAPATGDFKHYNASLLSYKSIIPEKITSTIYTLDGHDWALYLVLAIQPVITVSTLLVIALLHTIPIGKGFNMISMLGGIDPTRLSILRGSAFSGKLKKPIRVDVEVDKPSVYQTSSYDGSDAAGPRLRYVLEDDNVRSRVGKLNRGQIYE